MALATDGTVGPGAVPEPATWAMMIGGFGMIGGALRYRRRRTRVAFV
jgi:PEP-CTERM motif